MNELKEVREKIISAVPEIRQNFNRCMDCGFGFGYCRCKQKRTEYHEDRTIRLSDVLRAIGKTKGHLIAVEAGTGSFMRWESDKCGYDDNIGVTWPLNHDDLNFASPECLTFLHGLLV